MHYKPSFFAWCRKSNSLSCCCRLFFARWSQKVQQTPGWRFYQPPLWHHKGLISRNVHTFWKTSLLWTSLCYQQAAVAPVRSNLHDAGPLANNHDSLHPHPGATIWNVASRFKCHCLFDTSISPSGLIYASFALSPQFSRCLISVQLLRSAIAVHRAQEYIQNSQQTCKAVSPPQKNSANSSRCVFFFFFSSGIDLSAAAQFDPRWLCYISSVRAQNACRNMRLCDQCGRRNVSPCVSVAQHKWALKGTRLALLVLSQSLQLASNRKTKAETASVDIAESR